MPSPLPLSLVLASTQTLPMEDPGVCESCYAATPGQTLPVVLASVAIVLGVQWWHKKRSLRPAA